MRISEKLMPIKPHLKQNVNTILILRIGKKNSKLLGYKKLQKHQQTCHQPQQSSWHKKKITSVIQIVSIQQQIVWYQNNDENKLEHSRKQHGSRELKWKDKNKAMHHLQLLKGKASPSPRLHVVLESLALHNGAKMASSRAWEYLHSLLLTSCIHNIAGLK
jgi:hypothetical protein